MSDLCPNKIWIKPSGENAFIYGNHILKTHISRVTEDINKNDGCIVYNLNNIPLGFGNVAKDL